MLLPTTRDLGNSSWRRSLTHATFSSGPEKDNQQHWVLSVWVIWLPWLPTRDSSPTGKKHSSTEEEEGEVPLQRDTGGADVSDLLKDQLKHDQLSLLSGGCLTEALTEFVDKSENEAISE